MRAAFAAWLLLSGAGLLVIVLADGGRRLFSLSEVHGPTVTEAVGALILTAGSLPPLVQIWRRRARLMRRTPAAWLCAGAFALGLRRGGATRGCNGRCDLTSPRLAT